MLAQTAARTALLRGSGIVSLGLLLAQVLTAAFYLLAARAADPSAFGPVMATFGLTILLVQTLDLGLNSLTIRLLAEVGPGATSAAFQETLGIKLLLLLAVLPAWFVATSVLPGSSDGMVRLSATGYLGAAVLSGTLLVPAHAAQRMVPIALAAVLDKLTGLLALILLLAAGLRVDRAVALALLGGAALSAVFASGLVPRRSLRPSWSRAATARLLRSSVAFGLAGFAGQLQKADVAIVEGVAGPAAAGIFSGPARLIGPMGTLPNALSAALFPRVAGAPRDRLIARDAQRTIVAVSGANALLLAGLALAAGPVVALVLGPQWLASVDVLRVYAIAMAVFSFNGPLAVLLQARGHERYVGQALVTTVLLGLVVTAVGGATAGAMGAALGFLVCQLLTLAAVLPRAIKDAR